MPPDLQRRLAKWIDVGEVGAEGFWLWLRAVLALLPPPIPPSDNGDPIDSPGGSLSGPELRSRIVYYAREHARLTMLCEEFSRDNRVLSRRLKGLESALRTVTAAGHAVEIPRDPEADRIAEQYRAASRGRAGPSDPIPRSTGSRSRGEPR